VIERHRKYLVHKQGRCITPISIWVEVVWSDDHTVWYRKEGESRVYDTPRERFLEILKQKS
jgi:hypothetical protein